MIPCLYTFRDLQLSFVVPFHQLRCETEPWDGSRTIDSVVVAQSDGVQSDCGTASLKPAW